MALKATLNIVGVEQEYTVVEFEHRLSQTVNTNGIPIDGPHGGMLVVTINTPEKNTSLYDWMLSPEKKVDGSVCLQINARNRQTSFKTVHFADARCTNFYEFFNNQNKNMMTIRLVINAEKVYFIDGDGNGHGLDAIEQSEIPVPSEVGVKPLKKTLLKML